MISSFRKNLKIILPVVILVMVLGLVFSRVIQPEQGIPKPEIQINTSQAKDHIGASAEVCGKVVNVRYISEIGGRPTFINFSKPDPHQDFTAVIWGENRAKWQQSPEDIYPDKEVCVTGRIESHEGTPQIEVISTRQIRIK